MTKDNNNDSFPCSRYHPFLATCQGHFIFGLRAVYRSSIVDYRFGGRWPPLGGTVIFFDVPNLPRTAGLGAVANWPCALCCGWRSSFACFFVAAETSTWSFESFSYGEPCVRLRPLSGGERHKLFFGHVTLYKWNHWNLLGELVYCDLWIKNLPPIQHLQLLPLGKTATVQYVKHQA